MKIAVASGKGGTGKTLVATNLYFTAKEAGIPVVLTDCDAEGPNVCEFIKGRMTGQFYVKQHVPVIDPEKCIFCGRCHEYCNYHAIIYLPPTRFIQVVEDLCHDCGACVYACEHGAIIEKERQLGTISNYDINDHAMVIEACADIGVYSPVPVIRQAIHSAKGDDVLTIYDAPPGISCPFIATVEKADYVILVTEPTPFGLNDLKLSVATLEQMQKSFGVVVNRAGMGNDEVYKWLEYKSIDLIMEIPFDKEIARIYSEGQLLVNTSQKYSKLFTALIQRIGNFALCER